MWFMSIPFFYQISRCGENQAELLPFYLLYNFLKLLQKLRSVGGREHFVAAFNISCFTQMGHEIAHGQGHSD